jgi:hypothetical protein
MIIIWLFDFINTYFRCVNPTRISSTTSNIQSIHFNKQTEQMIISFKNISSQVPSVQLASRWLLFQSFHKKNNKMLIDCKEVILVVIL